MSETRTHEHRVHPRKLWAATGLALVGIVVTGAGVMARSWWIAAVGVLLIGIGVAAGLRSGLMYDVHAARPASEELEALRDDDVHEGLSPKQSLHSPAAQEKAEVLEHRRRAMERRAREVRPPLAQLGAIVLLLVALALLVAQWSVYPTTATGQGNGLHATYVAIVVALAGLRVITDLGRRHVLAIVVAALAGLALVVLAWSDPHGHTGVAVFETVCAGFILGAAAACASTGAP